MTIHSAKGLEFKNVFVVGLEENLFPSIHTDQKQGEESIEEERRLFYVAITRAKENAWLSYANQRYRWGNLDFCTPSRFLEELDEKYIDNTTSDLRNKRNKYVEPMEDSGFHFNRTIKKPLIGSSPGFLLKRPVAGAQNDQNSNFESDDPEAIQQGMTVEHQRFGEGKVISIEGAMPNTKATIFFPALGQKQLLLKFAKLKIKG